MLLDIERLRDSGEGESKMNTRENKKKNKPKASVNIITQIKVAATKRFGEGSLNAKKYCDLATKWLQGSHG